ncbi:hypothetical protein [Georgenia subflava]|uniref:Uncharacterized protein n=1 Tax=Georgenia subflava TaxID=1622177 RepID=A0A6N7EDI8_9MICO|nr:hypothetical protein [Georgenia subflava]MPV36169.1 hypothetical protein [Georgenia subflava]
MSERIYTITVPPGWARLELGQDVDAQVESLVARLTTGGARDSAPLVRRRVARDLRALVDEAAGKGALDLLVPVARVEGLTIPASIMATLVTVPATHASQEDVLLGIAARDSAAKPLAVGDQVALRTVTRRDVTGSLATAVAATEAELTSAGAPAGPLAQQVLDADVEPAVGAQSRHVRYLLAVPGRPRQFLTLTLAVLEPADDPDAELADALTELADAMVSTLRWV